MFGKKKQPALETPYTLGSKAFSADVGRYKAEARIWKIATFVSLMLAGIALWSSTYLATQKQIVPYVVAVDEFGYTMPIGRATDGGVDVKRLVVAEFSDFILQTRSTSIDAQVLGNRIRAAFVHVINGSPASNKLTEHFKVNDPFLSSKTKNIDIDVMRVLPLSERTFKVNWKETISERNSGKRIGDIELYEGIFDIEIRTPTDEKVIKENPSGLIIKDYNWGRSLG